LSEDKITTQAKEYWLWEEKEFYKLLIHSILHILWYDHEEDNDYRIMQEKEDLIWSEVFEK
jgi:rRNA maturation RNase YbeY